MAFREGKLEVTSQVRSVPLGQKRKRGRPKALGNCLLRSPPKARVPVSAMVPEVDAPSLPTPTTTSLPAPAPPAPLQKTTRKRKRPEVESALEVEPVDTVECQTGTRLKAGLGASKPPKKTKRVVATSDKPSTERPPVIICKKKKETCGHKVVLSKHYDQALWSKYEDYVRLKRSMIEIDPNYVG